MPLEVRVLTEKKGSNPGGRAVIDCHGRGMGCYFKYCVGSKLPIQSSFSHTHQPIYEAITVGLARLLGLNTPNVYVVSGSEVNFTGDRSLIKNLNPRMPYYFISEILPVPAREDPGKTAKRMKDESIYRDILQLSDIVGKKQNYFFYESRDSGVLCYLDVGCSFVHAVDGFIFMTNNVKNHALEVDVKRDKRRLKDYYLIPNDPNAQDLISLEHIINLVPELKILCINSKTCKRELVPIFSLLTVPEIADIQAILTYGMTSNLRAIKDSELIIREG